MSSLILDFTTITKRVSDFLGFTSTYDTAITGANLTRCKDIVYRAYRRYLFPTDMKTGQIYVWSFLHKTGTLVTEKSKWQYSLPADFIGLISGFKFNSGENVSNPKKIDISKLRAFRNASIAETDNPEYYAIVPGLFSVETGLSYDVWFHKTPNTSLTYKYEYIFEPEKPIETTDLFVGGIKGSEVVLQCALAAAELQEDEVAGPQEAKAAMMLDAFISYDMQYMSNPEIDPNILSDMPAFRKANMLRQIKPEGT